MVEVPIQELIEKVGSIYKLVLVASRRANELNSGGQRLVDANPKTKLTTVALQEIGEGRVFYKETAAKT